MRSELQALVIISFITVNNKKKCSLILSQKLFKPTFKIPDVFLHALTYIHSIVLIIINNIET